MIGVAEIPYSIQLVSLTLTTMRDAESQKLLIITFHGAINSHSRDNISLVI